MKSVIQICVIFTFAFLLECGNAANILGLMGCSSHSHHLWNEVIVNALAARGHTLTIASIDENHSPHPNVTYIHFEEGYNTLNEHYKNADVHFDTSGPFANMRLLYNFKMTECKGIFRSKGYQKAANLNQKFDLILVDISTGSCVFRLMQQYPNIPVVAVSPFKMDPQLVEIVGGHSYSSYIPFFLDYRDTPMNLWNRVSNAAAYTFSYFYRKFVAETVIEAMADKYVPGDKPSLESLYQRVKVALVNTHPAMDYAQSLPPNVIEVGGLHIKEPKELPKDISDFIETGKHGAVLISLGSNVKAEILGQKRLEDLISVIGHFPDFNFLWKIEKKNIFKKIPRNLLIREWLPQNDILASPKVRAFFTHAGSLSMQEAVWHGVPVVAMPLFLDQFNNAKSAQAKGFAYEVNFDNLSKESLLQAFSNVLTSSTYSESMRKVQKKFRDRQNKPLDTAIWWIEYFLRNPDTEHLSPSSRNMSYFVVNSLDIFLIVEIILIIFVVNIWILLKNLKKTFSKSKTKHVGKEKTLGKRKLKKKLV